MKRKKDILRLCNVQFFTLHLFVILIKQVGGEGIEEITEEIGKGKTRTQEAGLCCG